jgi:Peroxisomal biogenesis factor 11 (PEX11)
MKRSFSFQSISKDDVSKGLKKTTDNTKLLIVEITKIISNMMSSSKGRCKMCGIIQYAAKFRYYCNIHSNIPEVIESLKGIKNKKQALMSGRIVESMSRNKKIFRFLKFIDEFYKITELLKKQNKFNRLLSNMMILSKIGAFFYYILDNFLWAINTGILSK